MRTAIFAVLLLALPRAPALADTPPLFQCEFANGKTVTLTAADQGITYRFGRPGHAPELQLYRLYSEVFVTPWPGIGRTIWEEISLGNDGYTYRIWGALDKMKAVEDASSALSAGLIVARGEPGQDGEELAQLDCQPGSISYDVFAFSDTYEAAGYCWDSAGQIWKERCE